VPLAEALLDTLRAVLALSVQVTRRLNALRARLPPEALADLRAQHDRLVHARALSTTPARWRARLACYLRAMLVRLDKLEHGHARDADYTAEIRRLHARLADWRHAHAGAEPPAELAEFTWLIEELRVSLFAQQLGTVVKVSARRLDERWETLVQPA